MVSVQLNLKNPFSQSVMGLHVTGDSKWHNAITVMYIQALSDFYSVLLAANPFSQASCNSVASDKSLSLDAMIAI